jgi:hypothetical protein
MSTFIQRSFVGGVIDPSLYARTDTAKYQNGARTIRNCFVKRSGGAEMRPGTKFISEVKDSSRKTRIIPFINNLGSAYLIELGHKTLRVFSDDSISNFPTIGLAAASKANPCSITVDGYHNFVTGDRVYISGVSGMTELNDNYYDITVTSSNTFTLDNTDSSAYTTYTSGGTVGAINEFTTSFIESDLFKIGYSQDGNSMTLTHPDRPILELTENSGYFNVSTFSVTPGQAAVNDLGVSSLGTGSTFIYHITAVNEETFEESLADTFTLSNKGEPDANNHTLSWTEVAGAGEYNIYLESNGVPGLIGIARGDEFINDGAVQPDTSITPPTDFDPFSSQNYPSTSVFYQQRRLFANTDSSPNGFWGSKIGAFSNFTYSSPLTDGDAIIASINGGGLNEIKHMIDIGRLVILTSGGEWSADTDVLTPTSLNLRKYTSYGSGTLKPIIIGETALFVQNNQSIIRDLTFNFNVSGYSGNDLTTFSSHIFDGYSLVDWAYQKNPHSIVWAVRDDGSLLGLTYLKEQNVLAWHVHDMFGDEELDPFQFESYALSTQRGTSHNSNVTGANYDQYGQVIELGNFSIDVDTFKCNLADASNNISGDMYLKIYDVDANNEPIGSALFTSDAVDSASIHGAPYTEVTFSFSSSVILTGNKNYAFVVDFTGITYSGGVIAVQLRGGNAIGTPGLRYDVGGAAWDVNDSFDFSFILTGQQLTPIDDSRVGPRIESICTLPDGQEDSVYMVVRRVIDGSEVRYIEKMNKMKVEDYRDHIYMDSALSYDGRNGDSTRTMTLSGGTNWTYDEDLTLTCSSSFFDSGDVGNRIDLVDSDGVPLRCTIIAYTSATVVTVNPNKTVPSDLRSSAQAVWTESVDTFSGLDHLEGKSVCVYGDGFVVASPNNSDYDAVMVSGGSITLDQPYGVVHVGLPYIADIEPLDIEFSGEETLIDKNKNTTGLHLYVEDTRGIFAGAKPPEDDQTDPLDGLTEFKPRTDETYDEPPELTTGIIDINIKSRFTTHGRLFIRQIDPIPMTVLAIARSGFYPRSR